MFYVRKKELNTSLSNLLDLTKYGYRNVPICTNGSRQCLFLAILFHMSKRAGHEHVSKLIPFNMQVRFLYSHIPSVPRKPKFKGPMCSQLCKSVPSSTNAIRSVKFTYTEVKQLLFVYRIVVENYDKMHVSKIHFRSA